MNKYSRKLFTKDNVEDAIDYLTPSTIPYPMVNVYSDILKGILGEENIIHNANMMYVSNIFDRSYHDSILKMLGFAHEEAAFLEMNAYEIMVNKLMDSEESFDVRDLAKVSSRYLWLYVGEMKNERLFDYLVNYIGETTRYASDTNDIFVQLLPAENFNILDRLLRALAAYL